MGVARYEHSLLLRKREGGKVQKITGRGFLGYSSCPPCETGEVQEFTDYG